jgi:hypothetical protein
VGTGTSLAGQPVAVAAVGYGLRVDPVGPAEGEGTAVGAVADGTAFDVSDVVGAASGPPAETQPVRVIANTIPIITSGPRMKGSIRLSAMEVLPELPQGPQLLYVRPGKSRPGNGRAEDPLF